MDVKTQVDGLKASRGEDVHDLRAPEAGPPVVHLRDKDGWHPHVFISSVSIDPFVMNIARLNTGGRATNGAISFAFLKDPTDPKLAKDRAVKLYKSILKKYGNGANPDAVAHFYGMAVAFTMVDALRHAGKNLTRASLVRAATHLNERKNPFMRKGIAVRDERLLPDRPRPASALQEEPLGAGRRAREHPWMSSGSRRS